MAPTPEAGDRTRARLREAAAAIIGETGWGSVTTRGVAERAGVRSGLVHYHFDSVDDLKREAASTAIEGLVGPFVDQAGVMTPEQILLGAGRSSVEEYGPGTRESNLVYEVMLAAHRDLELQQVLHRVLVTFRSALADRIRACHPQAADRAELLAGLFAAAIDGLQLHLLAAPDLDLVAHLEPLLELLGPAHITELTA